jgi:predicted metal-dependent peptidase
MGPIAIAVDTSGSITMQMLSRFFAEISSIIEICKPEKVYLMYCDSEINGEVLELNQYDLPLKPEIRGGGGTAFKPVFDYIERKSLDLEWLVYITDLYGTFPEEPNYPVLWARTSDVEAPFGTHINLE